jgi:phosphoglycerol transferase MdoB-like AlkP superfamily enzyme
MSIYRFVFFIYYNELNDTNIYIYDIIKAFILGFRIDLTVIGYIQLPISLFLIVIYYSKSIFLYEIFTKYIKYYFFILYLIVTNFLVSDFAFYTYFKEHINILYFGLFEDDTFALLLTIWDNYNVPLILFYLFIFIYILYRSIDKIVVKMNFISYTRDIKSIFLYLFIIIINAMIIRGTFEMYPLGKIIPNVSDNEFINKIPHNGIREFVKAYKIKKRYNNNYDLISQVGFKNNMQEAFKIFKNTDNIDSDLIKNITYKTSSKNIDDYNVVIIMVESFGMPILKYQSKNFNIMGNLKQHFSEDTLFTNFISSGDGTIPSLEAMILNIPYRPGSFPISQSKFKTISYKYSPAFVFKRNGYNTSFMYGGDLSWREIGKFVKYQAYDNAIGKVKIYKNIKTKKLYKNEYFHAWGIYDEYLYDDIYKKLITSKNKEYIFALTTNNHPPYTVPKKYKLNKLIISEDLKTHITSNIPLIQKRFESYSYALDSLGIFLNKIKKSKLKNNTVVVVTADNNTIEGNMKYTNNPLLTSKNIPFYMYIPNNLKKNLNIDTSFYGSHKDIYPTLYNMILNESEYVSVGTNIMDKNISHYGVNASKIIINKNNIVKANDISKSSDNDSINYYRSLLAISQYILNIYK